MNTTEKTAIATTIATEYTPSETNCETGISPYRVQSGYFKGRRIVNGGNGTYITATRAHFMLRIKIEKEEYEIWVERIFKNLLGIKRLTSRIRQLISQTRPAQVEVVEKEGRLGTKYYTLSKRCAEEWAAWVGERVWARRIKEMI